MTEGNPISGQRSIVDRAKAIILTPKLEWPAIDGEPSTVKGLFTGYAMILAAIPPLATLIGGQLFGFGFLSISYKPALMSAISLAVVQYVFSLISVFVLALIIDALAPQFGGTRSNIQATKVAVYSATASWLVGIFSLIPALSVLGLLGLYSLYLLYTGLPVLMRAPEAKAMGYTVVTIVAAIVLSILVSVIALPVAGLFGGGIGPMAQEEVGGKVTIPGMGEVDLSKMEAASKKMEVAANKMEQAVKTGESDAVAPTALQAMLPESIGGYKRVETSGEAMGAGGSHAEGRYEAGDKSFRIEITDMAALGALTGLGAAMKVESNRQTESGYEKTSTIDGQIVTEEWDKTSGSGKYGTTIANRFMIEANGQAASIDELKAAVAAVQPAKLAALAK